jgi:hypothetical protein
VLPDEGEDNGDILLVGDDEVDANAAEEGTVEGAGTAPSPAQEEAAEEGAPPAAPPAAPSSVVTPEPAPPAPVPPTPVPPAPEAVNEAPFVVSVSPEDGEVGVAIGTPLVFNFSEPMDKDSVVDAYLNGKLFCGAMNWNAEATQLSIESCEGGAYGLEVDVLLSKSAKDASGLEMGDDFESHFRFVQKSEITLRSQDAYDGYVSGPGVDVLGDHAIADGQFFTVGTWSRGFLSFDLSELPEDLIAIDEASFNVKQSDHDNGAYGNATGALIIESVTYGSLTVDDFFKAANVACDVCLLHFLSTDAADGWKTTDVLEYVQADWDERDDRGHRSQFRLRFSKDCGDGNCADVSAEFVSGKGQGVARPYLRITYLHP